MKILMFSSDSRVVEEGSVAARRMERYKEALERLDILLLDRSRGRFSRFWKGYVEARNLLKKERYDLITTQEIEHAFLAWCLSRKLKIPFQIQLHTDIFNPYYVEHSVFNRVRVWLARFLIPRANCIRVVSGRIKYSLSRFNLDRITVLPIFSELSKRTGDVNLRKKYPEHDFIVLMVSRLTREKNIYLALEVLKEVIKQYPKTLLVIVGEGPEKVNIKYQISNIKIEGNVKFEGWQENLSGYYHSADCLLLTSNYEGYGLSVMEALQNGLSVIMTDVGIAGEIVKNNENGIIVPVGDKEAIVNAILELEGNVNLKSRLSENARKTPMPYKSFEEYREKLVSSWRQCLTLR